MTPGANLRTSGEDLRDLISMSKVHDLLRDVISFQNPGFNVEIAGKIQMFFHGISGLPPVECSLLRGHPDRETIGFEIVSHAAPPADQHGSGRSGREKDQNPVT